MSKIMNQMFLGSKLDTDFTEIFGEPVVEELPEKEYNEQLEEFGDDANKAGDKPPF